MVFVKEAVEKATPCRAHMGHAPGVRASSRGSKMVTKTRKSSIASGAVRHLTGRILWSRWRSAMDKITAAQLSVIALLTLLPILDGLWNELIGAVLLSKKKKLYSMMNKEKNDHDR